MGEELTAKEAAGLLGVPEAQLVRWHLQGVGPAGKGVWQPRYTRDALTDWLEAKTHGRAHP